jgi:phage/plasmid-like protein (TIGR03299 family)
MHEIEIREDGTANFVTSNRRPEWHRLGTTLGRTFTVQEAMKYAGLEGWNVRKIPVQGVHTNPDGTVTYISTGDEKFMTVRDNPDTGQPEFLGIVGSDYGVVQNEQAGDFLEALVDEAGAPLETAGSLRNGRIAFMTMALPRTMLVGGVDQLNLYLAITTSHDGSTALQSMLTPVRVVCANTHTLALNTTSHLYKVRHTANVMQQVAQARQALGLTWKYCDEFEREAEKMIQETLAVGEFRVLAKKLIRPSDAGLTERQVNNTAKTLDRLTELFTDADTQANIRGSRWAGFQAVLEWHEHERQVIRMGDNKGRPKDVVRAERALTGGLSWFQNAAFQTFSVRV